MLILITYAYRKLCRHRLYQDAANTLETILQMKLMEKFPWLDLL